VHWLLFAFDAFIQLVYTHTFKRVVCVIGCLLSVVCFYPGCRATLSATGSPSTACKHGPHDPLLPVHTSSLHRASFSVPHPQQVASVVFYSIKLEKISAVENTVSKAFLPAKVVEPHCPSFFNSSNLQHSYSHKFMISNWQDSYNRWQTLWTPRNWLMPSIWLQVPCPQLALVTQLQAPSLHWIISYGWEPDYSRTTGATTAAAMLIVIYTVVAAKGVMTGTLKHLPMTFKTNTMAQVCQHHQNIPLTKTPQGNQDRQKCNKHVYEWEKYKVEEQQERAQVHWIPDKWSDKEPEDFKSKRLVLTTKTVPPESYSEMLFDEQLLMKKFWKKEAHAVNAVQIGMAQELVTVLKQKFRACAF
jgi:hypothetical protein